MNKASVVAFPKNKAATPDCGGQLDMRNKHLEPPGSEHSQFPAGDLQSQRRSVRDQLAASLPPILFRNHPQFKELTGVSPRTVANEDSKQTGPRERIIVGRVIGYPRDAFLDWWMGKVRLSSGHVIKEV